MRDTKQSKHSTRVERNMPWPTINLKMEVVAYIEEEFTLGHDGETVGQQVDKLISQCMRKRQTMRILTIDLTHMQEGE